MTPNLNLGLCNLPEPIYLYVRSGGFEGKNYCWYYHDPDTKINTPEYATAMCGYLSELRLTSKEFKGKENMKLDIVVSANETYIIRTGVETNYAKSFLLAIALVEDLSRPLIIGCNAGEQNTVFCQVYDAITKSRFKAPWNAQADCASIIYTVQTKLGGVQEDITVTQSEPPTSTTKLTGQDLRIREIRTLLNYPANLIMEWLSFQGVTRPSELDPYVVDSLVRTVCLDWAKDKFDHANHAANSYQKHVLDALSNGVNEIKAIQDWVNYVMHSRTSSSRINGH